MFQAKRLQPECSLYVFVASIQPVCVCVCFVACQCCDTLAAMPEVVSRWIY